MKIKTSLTIASLLLISSSTIVLAQGKLVTIKPRVNVQMDSAKLQQVIDGEWVAVGLRKPHAIMHDYSIPFDGKPSYKFELKKEDNTLSDYKAGNTKGRAEFSYCYATNADFANKPSNTYADAQKMKTVYHYGKGIAEQGSSKTYTFSFYAPSDLSPESSTIFAQWHGMPSRKLAQTPDGVVKMLTDQEFLELYEKTIFKKDTGHIKVEKKDKDGNITYKAGKENGWKIEQGGYPPLAFGFSDGFFYIKANSDRKWLTDKSDRCNANVAKSDVMVPMQSEYKSSTIACKMPFAEFPKDTWVTFTIAIDWSTYGGEAETIEKMGKLDVEMSYADKNKPAKKKLVDNQEIMIGRNDEDGYYFKFGIYRVGNSTTPVRYNLAGYSEK